MDIATIVRAATQTDDLIAVLERDLPEPIRRARAVVVLYDVVHDPDALRAAVARLLPEAAVIGGSSNGGVLDSNGVAGPGAVGLWGLCDDDGDFGAASGDKGDDPAAAAERIMREAILAAGCPGQLPDLVWILQSPGREERVLDGLRRVVGDRCPVVGGSAADADLSGRWTQFGPGAVHGDGLAVLAFFCSRCPEVHFRGGYEPAGVSGTVTRVSAADTPGEAPSVDAPGRILREIDGRPASAVYNDWTGGAIADAIPQGGKVLAQTSMFPLAVETGIEVGVTQYLLVHPEAVLPDGALTTFADVAPGAVVHAMTGSKDLLIQRAGTVTRQARALHGSDNPPLGALVIFCGGCRLALGEDWGRLAPEISAALDGAPFLVGFTFGEQGPSGGRNAHGNLMISAVVFV
jgi:hypothetical protein